MRPTTGQSWWCLPPTVSTVAMSAPLAACAVDEGIDTTHRAVRVRVRDGAGGHTSGKLAVPAGIDLVSRPPASPERPPVERVWTLVDDPVANRTFADLDTLAEVLVTRCQTRRAAHHQIKAPTRAHWWARERRPLNPT